jgi:hypothetical protein
MFHGEAISNPVINPGLGRAEGKRQPIAEFPAPALLSSFTIHLF